MAGNSRTQKSTADTAVEDAAADTATAAEDTAVEASTADVQDAPVAATTAAPAPVEAPMSEQDAPAVSAADDPANKGKVPVRLAHSIDNPEHQRRLRLEVREEGYKVNDVIYVTPDDARAVITAGLAQVDPEDPRAVRDVLTGQANV